MDFVQSENTRGGNGYGGTIGVEGNLYGGKSYFALFLQNLFGGKMQGCFDRCCAFRSFFMREMIDSGAALSGQQWGFAAGANAATFGALRDFRYVHKFPVLHAER